MAEGGDRAREEFLSEAQEIVEGLGRDLLALDEGVRASRVDPALINDVFRAVHTLKGLAGLFGANRMATLSHELEELLDNLRLGRTELTADVLDLLFRSVELYGVILLAEKDGRDQSLPQVEDLVRELQRGGAAGANPAPSAQYELDPGLLAVLTEYEEHRLRANIAQGLKLYRLRVQFQLATIDQALDELKSAAKPHGEIITYLPTGAGADADSIELDILMASASPADELQRVLGAGIELDEVPRRAPPELAGTGAVPAVRPQDGAGAPAPRAASRGTSIAPGARHDAASGGKGAEIGTLRSVAQTVRVDIHKLNRLMNIVGELSLVRTSFAQLMERLRNEHIERELSAAARGLQRTFERKLEEMQKGILEVRMVPLGQVFDKLARVVRQISRDADKLVNLVITGGETEVDKLIVEELSDPLMHMMRNAIDHGIETRAEREAVGKPALGTIALNAFQKGNHVVIEIEDDGRGIDADGLVESALRRGLISAEDARNINRNEILNLVFVPGLSTKSDVSELSGRGVGMDVVKTNIGKLGGVIDLQSEPGIGTKVTVTLPITLAIISALVVLVEGRLFAVPLANVQEAVMLDPNAVRTIDGREVVTLRGSTLQLCRLARLFGLEGQAAADAIDLPGFVPPGWVSVTGAPPLEPNASGKGSVSRGRNVGALESRTAGKALSGKQYVVVTAVGMRRLGLVVNTLVGEQDVVIKGLGPSLRNVRGFAGASELGDHRIALVIDAPSLVDELHAPGERSRAAFDPRGGHAS
jgi:two-component system, chemotaxis family, sensor kinase CheA